MCLEKYKKILFIVADQMRADCMSSEGHPCVKTPNLDQLAADAVSFRKHFGQCVPCGPSRTSLLTGLYAMNHRSIRNGTPLDSRHTNIAKEIRKAGLHPYLFGYTDSTPDPRGLSNKDPVLTTYENVMSGFDPQCLMHSEELFRWRSYLTSKGYNVPEVAEDIYLADPNCDNTDGRAPTIFSQEDSDSKFLTDEILGFLALRRQASWCVHVAFNRPHNPMNAPAPYNRMYNIKDLPPRNRAATLEEECEKHPYLDYHINECKELNYIRGRDLDASCAAQDDDVEAMRSVYFGLITELDTQIGRIIDYLKETGEYDTTLIIFSSDHGEMLGDHWMVGKNVFFDQAVHVPMIIRDPRATADSCRGQVVSEFSEHVDILPTIIDWLNQPIPHQLDGKSLLPFLKGETPPDWRREAHWEFDFRDIENQSAEKKFGISGDECSLCVIRDERYKYVHFSSLPPLFFDLEKDPYELCDVSKKSEYQARMLEYAQKMLSWRMIHADQTLTHDLANENGLIHSST